MPVQCLRQLKCALPTPPRQRIRHHWAYPGRLPTPPRRARTEPLPAAHVICSQTPPLRPRELLQAIVQGRRRECLATPHATWPPRPIGSSEPQQAKRRGVRVRAPADRKRGLALAHRTRKAHRPQPLGCWPSPLASDDCEGFRIRTATRLQRVQHLLPRRRAFAQVKCPAPSG